ncbi:MAG: TusE/DsrC/DsvC family sulfur relay protein [Deltaproteobacteria bacterium]|jgi:tRNA 2-thiouridine synthesizing protein E|nr:TusE/DsrC/DsvC family sulfur relay protein [Deltaproteobacteria bacterium]MBW2536932.1 TusE/DsrC/DsvC family sulfur relay protein [Deltaproteobacteria bacterium]
MTPSSPAKVVFDGRSYTLDDHGFLFPPQQWDENFAEGMARQQGIHGGLTEEHWEFIHYLRHKYLVDQSIPLLVYACIECKMRLSKLKHLFPTGYHRGACRIAGIHYDFMRRDNLWHTYENQAPPSETFTVTPLGFLERYEDWNEGFALRLADEWQLPYGLTDRHREVLEFLRDYYGKHRSIPTVYETCDAHGLDLDELRDLFPPGYRRGACLMAGLPLTP